MLRGAFERGDGLVIPNNVTTYGAAQILSMALRDTSLDFYIGLCAATYDPAVMIESLTEPTIGTNGYARQHVTRDANGWPASGNVNGENYLETDWLTWAAVGGSFDKAITRMFICASQTALAGNVFALSAALPNELTIGLSTPINQRQFKYRLYLR